ncbi:MAG: bifunctional acetaldehyde-CoA/alcohol dehydrogenase [Christensenellaceae bacterium]|jgi:acetaldehyde dehydrogenase/alcohol dehydrogenase|nr:bifunctional acetaldehyde-CoA/alcohol dehydrogenase [Christensenellaceae bacterium]
MNDRKIVNDEPTLAAQIAEVRSAQKIYAAYTQEMVNKIFFEAAMAANKARIPLAKMAVEETGMGVVEDKVIKNHYAAEYVYNAYKDTKTCGVVEYNQGAGLKKIVEPVGVIAAVIPTTNPTSTAIFKALLALKTRNGIIFSPHPRAKKCTIEAAKIILDAAVKAGAPKNIIGWIDQPTVPLSAQIMKDADLILATGGPGMVKSAYSSGKPAVGVGPGNTPVIVDDSADIKNAASSILHSKTFDNGMICASEQEIIVHKTVYDEFKREMKTYGAYFLSKKEIEKVREIILINGALNAHIVGQSAHKIAKMAGVSVSENAKVLVGEVESVDLNEPFAHEKLSPILGLYKASSFEEALEKAMRLIEDGGLGHTSVLYIKQPGEEEKIERWSKLMKTCRCLINTPASQGAIGDLYNFKLAPSLTLGCGSWGGNSISENVGVKHLLNYKMVAERRENMLWFRTPEKVYFKPGSLGVALSELKVPLNKSKVFIVTDDFLYKNDFTKPITDLLDNLNIKHTTFFKVQPDPTLACAKEGAQAMLEFNPDAIIAIGGGSPIDAAKIMWVMYEHPEVVFEDLAMRFMDIRKRINVFPHMGEKAYFVAIPTTAGTGSEVTPFAVITDEKTGTKYPLADYELLPDMAIIDANLMMNIPKGLTAASGIDAMTHALEALASVLATDYTNGIAKESIKLLFEFLPIAYVEGANNSIARERTANASCMAGMAFANAFLGICHSMAHKLGSYHHLPHGVANALLINEVIKFNATDCPVKMGSFSQYEYPDATRRYADLADYLKLGGENEKEKIELLIAKIDELKDILNLPKSIKEAGVSENAFFETLDEMTEAAFDDQCTGANPRYPLITELKTMYTNAFYGKSAR